MSSSSELSKVYSQYQESLQSAQAEYTDRLKQFAGFLKVRYEELIKNHVFMFEPLFNNRARAQKRLLLNG